MFYDYFKPYRGRGRSSRRWTMKCTGMFFVGAAIVMLWPGMMKPGNEAIDEHPAWEAGG
jgi:hypothetical protein